MNTCLSTVSIEVKYHSLVCFETLPQPHKLLCEPCCEYNNNFCQVFCKHKADVTQEFNEIFIQEEINLKRKLFRLSMKNETSKLRVTSNENESSFVAFPSFSFVHNED
ncbi:CLUMA_CG015480, isoform A [Clunio marinus]|uniref:CLUMA_CG015480, isoform A n=1 Tax=Clunio marinus TaxID=568069 RepID=A0A1J1IUD4_9DIPT|nr:CLUMA_CG015480, isoform A [Clunio marinus]